MRLAPFIRENTQTITEEWVKFARKIPAADDMGFLALRDHIKDILVFIADDMDSSQTAKEEVTKSEGDKQGALKISAAEVHAALRLSDGFDIDQMVSEYRALRGSIIRLWAVDMDSAIEFNVADLIRFNEAIDQQLTESISHYTKKLDHSRNLFLGILSHDLRTPLGAIRMSAELSLILGGLNARQHMLIKQNVDSANRASEIVTALLDLAKTKLGTGLPVTKCAMNMGALSRQIIDEVRSNHPSIILKLDIIGDTEGEWDKSRVGQMLSNLLSNAVQYGFPDLPISVAVTGLTDDVNISIHNFGLHIPQESIGRIFDSLVRGEDSYLKEVNSPNLGLGLYISKQIVTAHKGNIGVISSQNEGTTFTASFPR